MNAPPTLPTPSSLNQQRTQKYLLARQQHPAWRPLASPRAPLILSCLDALFEHQRDGVPFDMAVHALADMLAAHANDSDFEIELQDTPAQARRELREWIRRALITEREVAQFMKTGQAAENQRVGELLNDILNQALQIDWRRQATRRSDALEPQHIELRGMDGRAWRFTVPRVEVTEEGLRGMEA